MCRMVSSGKSLTSIPIQLRVTLTMMPFRESNSPRNLEVIDLTCQQIQLDLVGTNLGIRVSTANGHYHETRDRVGIC